MTSTVWKPSWRYGEIKSFGKKSDLKLDHDLTNQSVETQSLNF